MKTTFHSRLRNRIQLAVVLILAAINLGLIYGVAPLVPDQEMAQKIFYYHVPLAWNAFLAYVLAAVTAVMYLVRRDIKWDAWSLAGAEVGTVFAFLILVTGPIWATPMPISTHRGSELPPWGSMNTSASISIVK